ncbi:MAG: hypothetical protein ACON5B_14040 [Myxococcota bacterium]
MDRDTNGSSVRSVCFCPNSHHLVVITQERDTLLTRTWPVQRPSFTRVLDVEAEELCFWGQGREACLVTVHERVGELRVLRWPSLELVERRPYSGEGLNRVGDRHLVGRPSALAWLDEGVLKLIRRGPPGRGPDEHRRPLMVADLPLPTNPWHMVGLATDAEGRRFISGAPGSALGWFCAETWASHVLDTDLPDGHPFGHLMSPDGGRVAWCSRRLEFAEAPSNELLGSAIIEPDACHKWAGCFLPGGDLVFGVQIGRFWVIDLTRQTVHDVTDALGWAPVSSSVAMHRDPGNAQLQVSPDGQWLAVGCYGEVRCVETTRVVRARHAAPIHSRLQSGRR